MQVRAAFRAAALAVALTTLATLTTVAGPAAADPPGAPSTQDIQRGKDLVAQRAQQVADARAKVAATTAQLATLGQAAEIAVEHYNEAQVKLAGARKREQTSRLVLAAAQKRVDEAQQRMNGFVAAAYMSGGDLVQLNTLISADAPQTFLRKMSSLDAVSKRQRDAVGALSGARAYQHVLLREAQSITQQTQQAAAAADAARHTAEDKVARQQAVVSQLQAAQNHLEDLLAGAQANVQRLERARQAAIARQQALERQRAIEAARRAAEAAARQPLVIEGGNPGAVAVRWAMKELGVPYAWGGGDANGPTYGIGYGSSSYGFDCSGLTLFAYAHAGIYLDHWTGSQWNSGRHVDRSQLQPGDLVFFATDTTNPDTIHHVAIYIGNGRMIEAPYTGSYVRISSAFRPDYIGAVRPYAG
ncbi:MAG TPA: NlpC/P60 family protein [Mycobacteriales bacterium]|nr:NlpC/P60 family protein [Mycobacteriales bacterium]